MRSNQLPSLYQSKCAKEHDKTSMLTRDKISLVHEIGPSGMLEKAMKLKAQLNTVSL